MRTEKKGLQLNKNAGFSLVELLIGVTILAVITVPLLHMFVTSNKINAKSRLTLRATVLAQDVMEGLKAYGVEELKEQFSGSGDFEMVGTALLTSPDVAYYEDVAKEIAENGANPEDATKANPGLYYFVMKNVTMEKSLFDVLVTVDARAYSTENPDASGNVTYKSLNNNRAAQIAGVDQSADAWYQQTKTFEESVLQDVKEHYHIAEDVTYETTGLTFKGREIMVSFEDGGLDADNNQLTDAKITYKYTFGYSGEADYESYGSPLRERIYEYPCGSFTGSNFYLFYYPLYQGKDDKITFECKQTNPLNLYVAKQLDTDLTDAQLNAAEIGYKAVVNVIDTNGLGKEHFSIRTNLGHNLVIEAFLGAGISPKIPSQAEYRYNGAVTNKTLNIYNLSGVRDLDKGVAGTDDTDKEFIYDVVVEVYEQGAADAGFPADMRKISIDGTKK